ncbi:uncharacterized protein RHOBADRAFT_56320 [Rhodotorula graminis WP1]|uniref:50S ribosomal protein L10 n=1 Tax=Rhodotorula graminis (strain WP1) TaxID=578459 RepID=A0A0P9ER96_RHOGW|nr:uncharacterized protein RHOBADRAFT_56320 [Rhodotorula graminis WP1]KPV71945.1 hypothetical protein RHOBADRAFT_56320 [Rhodotorula graminis WP1]
MAPRLAPKVVARTRPLPLRKQVLFRQHEHLLTANPLVLFLRPSDFSAHEWRALRANLAQLAPSPATPSSSSSTTSPAPLSLTVLRPGLLPALLRDPNSPVSRLVDPTHLASASHLQGPLAVLTAPSVDPPTLSRVLTLVQTFSRTPKPNSPPPPAPGAPGGAAPPDRLALLSALVDHSAADVARTHAVAKLPTLDVLRAQLVALVSQPGSRIAGVVGARAGELARTLDGFKLGLADAEASQGGAGEGAQAQAQA